MADIVKGINGQDDEAANNGRASVRTARGKAFTKDLIGFSTFAHAEFDDDNFGTDLSARLKLPRYYTGDSPTDIVAP